MTSMPHESRIVYLPWLISCRLLWLNAGVQGEHLASQLSWAAAWLLVTHACPVHLVDELFLVFYGFSSMGSWCYFKKLIWNSRTKLCCIFQESEMSAGFHSRNTSGLRWEESPPSVKYLLNLPYFYSPVHQRSISLQ